jgi:hypothetical protein
MLASVGAKNVVMRLATKSIAIVNRSREPEDQRAVREPEGPWWRRASSAPAAAGNRGGA